jgi:hypothetical protein
LFADDCLLYREINTQGDHDMLQQDLADLENWAEKWGMRFNAKKCYTLSMKKRSLRNYALNNHISEQVPSNPNIRRPKMERTYTCTQRHKKKQTQRSAFCVGTYNIVPEDVKKTTPQHT